MEYLRLATNIRLASNPFFHIQGQKNTPRALVRANNGARYFFLGIKTIKCYQTFFIELDFGEN